VIDTAGLEEAAEGTLEARAQARTEAALGEADLVLLLVDGRAGVTPPDRHFADWLRRHGRPLVLVVNKAEGTAAEDGVLEAYRLGLGDPVAISAQHGEGLAELYEAITAVLPAAAEREAPGEGDSAERGPLRLAVIGRPNVGKSTLVNRLLGAERVLAGPEPGITRDAIEIPWAWKGRPVVLIDTAGLRRRARVDDRLEKLAVADSFRAVRACEGALLLVDATRPLQRQDLTIAARVVEEGRALVIAANKWDLVAHPEVVRRQLRDQLEAALAQARGVRAVPVSARTGRGLDRLLAAAFAAREVWSRRVATGPLNRWLEHVLARHPPPLDKGRRVKIRYITQISARPPTFALFVNRPKGMPESYRRYLVNDLRVAFDLAGTPIRLVPRAGKNPYAKN
jgi:GTP-binding protein